MIRLALLFGIMFLASTGFADVQGFQAWKTARIDEARAALEKIQPAVAKAAKPEPKKAGRPELKVQQAQQNLEIAQELSVNDYFVLYLSELQTRDAFIEVAKKLSPEETADLMLAYQKHLTGSHDLDVPAPSSADFAASSLTKK